MGSLEGRISRLEGRVPSILAEAEEEERERLSRAITRMILDEFACLKASREEGDLLERAVRRVVEDQYEDLGPESRRKIADGWTETLHSWTRLDWMMNARRGGPPT